MHPYVLDVLNKNGFKTDAGEWHSLTSAISITEAQFIENLIKEYLPKKTLEIGCAEGVSSMVICGVLGSGGTHTILDPNQDTQWKRMGIKNLEHCGFSNYELTQDYSEFALPALLKSGQKYDFIFVDGWHTFDHVMLEFFYINRLLNVGGLVVFDDVALVPLNRLMRYISNYPNFEALGSAGEFYESTKRKKLDSIKAVISLLTKPFGRRIKEEFLNDSVVRSNKSLKIEGSITAFRKTAEDTRGWAWYKAF